MVGEGMLLITRIKEERVILSVNLTGPEELPEQVRYYSGCVWGGVFGCD